MPAYAAAAAGNAAQIDVMVVTPFRTPEPGWRIYAPLLGAAARTTCPPATSGYAAAVARWQKANGVRPADGFVRDSTIAALYQATQRARPLVRRIREGCPSPPVPEQLVTLLPAESHGKPIQLARGAAEAFRRMRAAAVADLGPRARRWLTVYSGFRSPDADAARCATEGNCDGRRRAVCSPHRTGEALDLYLGYTPPDSTVYVHRRAIALTPAYAWLAANAGRFGFANYMFEPWHWEWTGGP